MPIHTLVGYSVKFVINSIPTCCTNSSEEEVFEDTETTTSFDTQTAELLSQLEEFNPQLRLKDIYVYPNQTSYELPPKSQANSRSEPIELEPEPDIIPIEPEQVSFLMPSISFWHWFLHSIIYTCCSFVNFSLKYLRLFQKNFCSTVSLLWVVFLKQTLHDLFQISF